jgi:integrase
MKSKRNKPIRRTSGNVVVKVYCSKRRKGDAVYWQYDVSDYSSGKREFKSFADKAAAIEEADRIADRLSRREGESLNLTGADRHSYLRALELLKPTGLALELIAAQFAEAFAKLNGRSLMEAVNFYVKRHPVSLPSRTVKEVFDEMLAAKKNQGLSARYIEDLNNRLVRFVADFGCQISTVTGAMIQEWIQRLDVANRTRNNFKLTIQALVSFAKAKKYLPADWEEFDSVPSWKEAVEEVGIFTPEDMATLLSHAPKNLVPFIAIAGFAGLRTAEAQRLDWSKVDLVNKQITVDAAIAKTNSRRVVPISANLKSWLAPYVKLQGPVVEILKLSNAVQRLVAKTRKAAKEVPWKQNGLRHSFCSYRLATVKSVPQVAFEAGNSVRVVMKHYHQLVTKSNAKRWFSIEPGTENVVNLPAKVA